MTLPSISAVEQAALTDLQPAHAILTGLADGTVTWAAAEHRLREVICAPHYLGGDNLRPYITWSTGGRTHLAAIGRTAMPVPPFVTDMLNGTFGPTGRTAVIGWKGGVSLIEAAVEDNQALSRRLAVPDLLLIGLGDPSRYHGARLPLGIARLSQWIRFTHAARVSVHDFHLLDDPMVGVARSLAANRFDIVGISVNFGQWGLLEHLAELINACDPPLVVAGNILAAFSPGAVARLFKASTDRRVLIASSLGERPLEQLCRRYDDPSAWSTIAGLIRPSADQVESPAHERPVSVRVNAPRPPDLVYPDDMMVRAIAERRGQISLETSFGCQYGACTFCPRDHRGPGWARGHQATITGILEQFALLSPTVVSLVDEEFFGAEGLGDPPDPHLPAADILAKLRALHLRYEIYTRIEQIFDRRRSREWNLARARLLAREAASMRRIFVGVESGSPRQLMRYGKGQTVPQIVDSLRVGSTLGVPMEFGFITFDPLLPADELLENIEFLARRDVIAPATRNSAADRAELVDAYLAGTAPAVHGDPIYRHVAYMATELEVLAHSRYAVRLARRHPERLDGSFDPGFARYGTTYQDSRVAEVAGWCRTWTEGMFTPVYEARMAARAAEDPDGQRSANGLITRYRDATFTLLGALTVLHIPRTRDRIGPLLPAGPPYGEGPRAWLSSLAAAVLPGRPPISFNDLLREQRRSY